MSVVSSGDRGCEVLVKNNLKRIVLLEQILGKRLFECFVKGRGAEEI